MPGIYRGVGRRGSGGGCLRRGVAGDVRDAVVLDRGRLRWWLRGLAGWSGPPVGSGHWSLRVTRLSARWGRGRDRHGMPALRRLCLAVLLRGVVEVLVRASGIRKVRRVRLRVVL